jgi:hypothetical protein
METCIIQERLGKVIERNVRIADFGIGHYECWGATGVDKRMGLEYDGPNPTIDVTDCFEEEETPESVTGLTLPIEVSKSGGGDPDDCAESGRRSCHGCNACDEYGGIFTATLEKVEKKDDRFIGHFTVE